MGADYWMGLRQQLDGMVAQGAVDAADSALFFVTDAVDHALAHVRTLAIERFGLTEARLPKPTRWLGEVRSPSS